MWYRVLLLSLVAFSFACEGGDEEFLSCSLDPKVKELGLCVGEESGVGLSVTEQNCAISEHPQCPRGVCLDWPNQEPFCTEECSDYENHTDCPTNSLCETYRDAVVDGDVVVTPAIHYCVLIPEDERE